MNDLPFWFTNGSNNKYLQDQNRFNCRFTDFSPNTNSTIMLWIHHILFKILYGYNFSSESKLIKLFNLDLTYLNQDS